MMEALSWLLLAVAVGLFWHQFGSDVLGLIDRHPVDNHTYDGEAEDIHSHTVRVIPQDTP